MASFLGLKLLRVAPLVSATAGVMCAWDQQFAFQSFVDDGTPQDAARAALPYWLSALFRPLIWVVSIIHPLGGFLGVLNGVGHAGAVLDNPTRWLYLAGGTFAFGHLVYGRTAMRFINTMRDRSVAEQINLEALRPWLRVNMWRIRTNNLPAWACFLTALIRVMEIREI